MTGTRSGDSPSYRRKRAFRALTQRLGWLEKKAVERRERGQSVSFLTDEADAIRWFMGEYKRLTGWPGDGDA